MSPRNLVIRFAALLAACLPASPGFAADASGRFSMVEMGTHDYTSMEHAGKTVTVGALRGAATVIESSGGLFAADDIYFGTCLVYLIKSDAGIDLESSCTFTDPPGDSFYTLATRRAGDIAAGGGGRGIQKIVGGTGKFAGLTGDCPYTSRYLPNNEIVSHATCEWRKP